MFQNIWEDLCFMKLTVKLNLLLGSKGELQKKGIIVIILQLIVISFLIPVCHGIGK